jgi:hypothetical protein
LRFAKELREAPAMESELKDFRRHVSEAGRYSFEARSGTHTTWSSPWPLLSGEP